MFLTVSHKPLLAGKVLQFILVLILPFTFYMYVHLCDTLINHFSLSSLSINKTCTCASLTNILWSKKQNIQQLYIIFVLLNYFLWTNITFQLNIKKDTWVCLFINWLWWKNLLKPLNSFKFRNLLYGMRDNRMEIISSLGICNVITGTSHQ